MKKSVLILSLSVVMLSSCDQKDQEKYLDPAFVHTVYFWLHNPDSKQDRLAFETSLKKFLNSSKYAKTKFIGTSVLSEREVVDDSFTYSLIVSFESQEAQDLYQNEEPHLLFIKESSQLWSKVIVYDSNHIP